MLEEGRMNDARELLRYESLAFFGKVNASISHELKNIMAIISETAGLLGDLAEMASAGNPLQIDVLKNCVTSIEEEIQRGFSTIRQMNRFAHSIDNPIEKINLLEVLELVTNLSAFLSFAGSPRIALRDECQPEVFTCPFLIQNVFYQALVHAYRCAGPGMPVEVVVGAEDRTAWRVSFSWERAKTPPPFPDNDTADAAAAIGVAIVSGGRTDGLDIVVPLQAPETDG
jgi:signal transduction histidine kinase